MRYSHGVEAEGGMTESVTDHVLVEHDLIRVVPNVAESMWFKSLCTMESSHGDFSEWLLKLIGI